MGHEFIGLMKRPWTTTPWKSFFVFHGIFNAIKRPWKATHEKYYKISHENTIKILWKSHEITMN